MKRNILVIGSGFAGVWSALSASRLLDINGRDDVQITVLAPQPELRIRPRFYEPNVQGMTASVAELFNVTGIKFIAGQATHFNPIAHRVEYTDETGAQDCVTYDRLILATGSQLLRPQLVGVAQFAFDVDTLESASRLDDHIKRLAAYPESPARNTVVVCGGGFTGIETAAQIPARLRSVLGADVKARVIVVDRASEIGGAFGKETSSRIAAASTDLGIEWCLNTAVASVHSNGVTLSDGRYIEASTVIWTAGLRASPLTVQIMAERDVAGRLHVDTNLKVIGQDAIYACGDVAYAAADDVGNFAAMSCQHAISLGRHAGNNAAADLIGLWPRPYSQPQYVTCLDLGEWGGIYTEGWERDLKLVKGEAKRRKIEMNTLWIYPPAADRTAALVAADPAARVW